MVPLYEKHDFWDTQPVPNTTTDKAQKDGPIVKGDLKDVK